MRIENIIIAIFMIGGAVYSLMFPERVARMLPRGFANRKKDLTETEADIRSLKLMIRSLAAFILLLGIVLLIFIALLVWDGDKPTEGEMVLTGTTHLP